ncbi:Ribosomal protein S27a [Cynara cardunculus var. scolymus]|uniref:Ribosomal protein S27a n=1 Tax=Cynara cardunculus var. scolymus TaxID=59895 RepID=A0A118JX58_CYNCS|nr:Ribosomal protein S27a [Cynara cardunculus var. scolymus]
MIPGRSAGRVLSGCLGGVIKLEKLKMAETQQRWQQWKSCSHNERMNQRRDTKSKPAARNKIERENQVNQAKRFYKVDDSGKVQRLRKECPNAECGAGTFMANHFDRHYCGKVDYKNTGLQCVDWVHLILLFIGFCLLD